IECRVQRLRRSDFFGNGIFDDSCSWVMNEVCCIHERNTACSGEIDDALERLAANKWLVDQYMLASLNGSPRYFFFNSGRCRNVHSLYIIARQQRIDALNSRDACSCFYKLLRSLHLPAGNSDKRRLCGLTECIGYRTCDQSGPDNSKSEF